MSDQEAVQGRIAAATRMIDAGNAYGAGRMLKEALAIDPEHPRANALMALALYRHGHHLAAVKQAEVAIGLDPSSDAFRFKALGLRALKRTKAAVEAGEAAVRAGPYDSLAALVLGLALEEAKRPKEAEAAMRRAVDIDPGSDSLKGSLGCFLLRNRDMAGAMQVAAELSPEADDASALLLRGHLALRQGRHDEARDHALWVLERNATEGAALRLLTQVKASRSPLMGLWWRYSLFMASAPWWQKILVMLPVAAVSILVFKGLWLLLVIYLRFCQILFSNMVKKELKTVKLKKGF
jgi:Tfp pilus assembly protein PilF